MGLLGRLYWGPVTIPFARELVEARARVVNADVSVGSVRLDLFAANGPQVVIDDAGVTIRGRSKAVSSCRAPRPFFSSRRF
ncbi:hypothetical protein [Pannonibacter phragmitetus]|uniref:hypothetical protein n=1 Tax=Pannonibacter phragmitetus TaxID=121719 RepID=UPI003D2ECA4D